LLGNTINTIYLSKGGMYIVKVMNGSDDSLVEKVYLR
jgi:hypothetical protein